MLIECWQQKVKDVTLGRKFGSCPYGIVFSDILQVTFQRGTTDLFHAYYETPRTSDVAPHYHFANIMGFDDVALFLKRFGFPVCDGGRDIILGEFLVEAKRLYYAMKAWASVTQKAWTCARESLAELSFARGHGATGIFGHLPSMTSQKTTSLRSGKSSSGGLSSSSDPAPLGWLVPTSGRK